MLKKSHILCRINTPRVKPLFLVPGDENMLAAAGSLINLFQHALTAHLSRNEIDELSKNFIDTSSQPAISNGMNKLLLDRCKFSLPHQLDHSARRRELFLKSAERFKSGQLPETAPEPDIYGDLPGFERLESMNTLTAAQLLDRYNLAQAQALLMYADELHLQLADPDTAALRKVMKAIKFFRLLADFSAGAKGKVNITVSGPYALFGPSTKYAVSLASLLPVAVNTKQWKLEANIHFKGRILKLKLDEKSGYRSPQRSFSSYIPEEIRLYHRLFAEKSADWQIVGDTPFIHAGTQEIIFPDLSFKHLNSGKIIHLELFHRWHAGQLERRLKLLQCRPDLPLIIGIDRAIADENKLAELCSGVPELSARCWLFRDFPGVESTLRVLNRNPV